MDKLSKNIKKHFFGIVLVLVGSLTWSFTMVKSGIVHDYGMGFWGPNGHDGIWHLAIANSLTNGSFNMPIFAGGALKNYHIGFDLLLAFLHKITFLPLSNLYFQIIPPTLALGIGVFVYLFVFEFSKDKSKSLWATFFVYFGGSWGWLVNLVRSGNLGGESMFWSQQSISTLINPPFALSLLIMFLGLIFLQKGLEKNSKRQLTFATFCFGVLMVIKVYAGILVLGGLLVSGLYQMLKRDGLQIFKVFGGALLINLILFLPLNLNSSSSIVWQPFWFVETMMQLSDRLGWQRFGEAMVNYRLGGVWLKAGIAYTVGFFIFWYGNIGTRILGEIYLAKKFAQGKSINYIEVLLLTIILGGITFPLLFVQKGTPWNTIQFLYYALIFSGIFAGMLVGEMHKTKTKYLFIALVIFFTIPTTYSTLKFDYLPSRPPAKLSNAEIQALGFLSSQKPGAVLTYPFDPDMAREAIENPPRPLYLYESTAYVSAFSKHDVYLEDEVNLNITGYDWPVRRERVEEFLSTLNQNDARAFLEENNIKYIYWIKGQRAKLGETQLGIEKIFENLEVDIYRVKEL